MTGTSCVEINSFNASEQCRFYYEHTECQDSDGQLDYLYFIFCIFQGKSPFGAALCILWLLMLFVALGTTADDFLCPSLVVITKTLRLSQNIAGVTFLAFGNGAPDIFSSVAGIQQARPQLVIGTLFGAGIFVTSVVSGSIIVSRPFKIMERPFLRDTIFYICASFWAFIRFYYEEFTLWHTIGFIGLYAVYILVVIISRVIYRRSAKKKKEAEQNMKISTIPTIEVSAAVTSIDGEGEKSKSVKFGVTTKNSTTDNEGIAGTSNTPNPDDEDNPEAEGIVLRRFSFRGSIPGLHRRSSSVHHEHILHALRRSVDHHSNPLYQNGSLHYPPTLEAQMSKNSLSSLLSHEGRANCCLTFRDFLIHVCPIDIYSWSESSIFSKVVDIIKAPIRLLLTLTIPVVDYDSENCNWCKTLNILHCVTCPMFIVYVVGEYDSLIRDVVPYWTVVLSVSVILALIVFFTSIEYEPPFYHWLYSYVGFVTSVMWVYLVATEIVSLLRAMGIFFRLSDTILGLTVLAWGNSIGDFISNLSVARKGYPRMGISACYGGPLLNLLLGIGIPYTVMIVKNGKPIELEFTVLVRLLYATLSFILLSTVITMTALRFNARRYFGVFLLCCYCVFVVTAVLLESKVI